MKDSSTNTLFQLLRLALGNKEECSLSADVNWRNLIDLSFEQGVAAIAVNGLQKLCGQHPEMELALDSPELEDLKYEWFGEVIRSEDDLKKYVDDIASLAKVYSEAGIETMILKGYGLSLNYPDPSHRPTGDIDVYLANDNDGTTSSPTNDCERVPAWKRGDEIIRQRGIAIDYSHHHHSVFNWKGQMVENHYDIVNRCTGKSGRMEDDMFTLPHISLVATSLFAIYLIGHCS